MSAVFEHGYAVVVGAAGYRSHSLPALPLAVLNDAVDLARALWDPEICAYRADRVRLLLEEQATAERVLRELEWLVERTTAEDTAIFFFSGHGWRGGDGSYLVCHDATTEPPLEGMISCEVLTSYLRSVPAGRLAVVLDSCYSGGAEIKGGWHRGDGIDLSRGLDERTYEMLSTGHGRVLLASSGPDEESIVLDRARNSLFTSCLLRGLQGEVTVGDAETLGIFDLFHFISAEVRQGSAGRQRPLFKGQVMENFPVALRRSIHRKAANGVPGDPAAIEPRIERTINTVGYVEAPNVGNLIQVNQGKEI